MLLLYNFCCCCCCSSSLSLFCCRFFFCFVVSYLCCRLRRNWMFTVTKQKKRSPFYILLSKWFVTPKTIFFFFDMYRVRKFLIFFTFESFVATFKFIGRKRNKRSTEWNEKKISVSHVIRRLKLAFISFVMIWNFNLKTIKSIDTWLSQLILSRPHGVLFKLTNLIAFFSKLCNFKLHFSISSNSKTTYTPIRL